MEEIDILKGRINDLSLKTKNNLYLTFTNFLSQSEQGLFFKAIGLLKGNNYEVNGVRYLLYGGSDDSDRKIVFFLPDYLTDEDIINDIESYITLFKIEAKNPKYQDELTHRDFLGALMNLGLERDNFGDIIIQNNTGFLYALKGKDEIILSLDKVKHTDIVVKKMSFKEVELKRNFINKEINVPSLRLDAVMGEVFNLSRANASELITNECVYVDGKTIISPSYNVKENDRVSIRGKGKFIFSKVQKVTRKDRLSCLVRIYA